MCGFVAIVRGNGHSVDPATLNTMNSELHHRGPDDVGIFIDGNIGLAFSRLAILDLSQSGHQPMSCANRNFTVVFNGEIFNYVELREELKSMGSIFRSSGDTEVLLEAYIRWGREMLPRLNGMFSFAIFDKANHRIFGARDRFGVKPLYKRVVGDTIALASEIKAFRTLGPLRVSRPRLSDLLVAGRPDNLRWSEETVFEGIEEISPGSCFEIGRDGKFSVSKWWNLTAAVGERRERIADGLKIDDPDAYARLFDDAVRLRLRSDVSVGVMLSGGLDSTSIVCAMAREINGNNMNSEKLHAFLHQDPAFDESVYVNETLAQTGAIPHRTVFKRSELFGDLIKLTKIHDEPVHSATSLIGYWLYRLASQAGIRVVLGGQGADETLAGYTSYYPFYWTDLLRSFDFGTLSNELSAYGELGFATPSVLGVCRRAFSSRIQDLLPLGALRSALRPQPLPFGLLSTDAIAAAADRHIRERVPQLLEKALQESLELAPLPTYLRIEDRNSMAHSVEARLPFMDYRLVVAAFAAPSSAKIRAGQTKVLLRDAMKGRIPESVRVRKDKMGFPVDTRAWFMGELREPTLDLLHTRRVRDDGIFDFKSLMTIAKSDSISHSDAESLFRFLQTTLWLTQVVDQ